MKKLFRNFFTFLLCLLFSGANAQNKHYQLNTPQKFVESLCMIGESPADTAAVPVFYDKISTIVITTHDSAILLTKNSFEEFKSSFKRAFPEHILANEDNLLEIKSNSNPSDNTGLDFSFSGFLIYQQLATYKKGDFKYVSFTDNQNGSFILSVVKNNKIKPIPLVREDSNYKMKMSEKTLNRMRVESETAFKLDKLFGKFIQDMESGKINPKNYDKIVMNWIHEYNKIREEEKKANGN